MKALASIRAQTYTDYEIIAIDDGSEDDTRAILALQPDVIAIFNETNLGTYGSLNVALSQAQGEFVAILNDDDVWMPRKLERQVAMMDANPLIGLVHTDGEFIDGKGDVIPGNPLGFRFPRFETGDILCGLVFENKIIASAALARTDLLRELGGFNERYFGSGDWEMWFRVAEVADCGFVNEKLTQYRVHGTNASHKLERIWRDDELLREWIDTRLTAHLASGRIHGRDEAEFGLRGFNYAALGTVKMLNGKPTDARLCYRKSIRHSPARWKSYARYVLTFAGADTFRRFL
jgi:glycosyltransferase involved in cell wall biosynthesis